MLSICFGTPAINAQILQDTASIIMVRQGIDSIFSMQFSYAEEVLKKISKLYPDHPVTILFRGIMTYWQNYPLMPNSVASSSFEKEIRKSIGLCEKKINPSYDAEYLLANLGARGLLLTFYADNGLSNDVYPLATSTYKYVRRSVDFTSYYPDFFFFTGLYNYYREVYPKVHPVYKSFAFLFPKGNREKGLNELELAAQNSILLKAESFSYLSYIYLNYENNYQQASYFSRHLHDLYPANPEFLTQYIKNLLLIKGYDEAEGLIISNDTIGQNAYTQSQFWIFKGILQEKKYHDYELAGNYYNTGIRNLGRFGEYGNEFVALGYFGLSRIAGINGEKENKKIYSKRAMKLADSKRNNFDD